MNSATNPQPETRVIWDLPVRVFHWVLVLAFIGAYVTHELGVEYFKYHLWCGYTVLVLVAFRIVWGLIGTRHALFWNFVRGPIATARYTIAWLRGRATPFPGHNPLGAWMVLALLAGLLVQAITGLFANDEIMNFGPLYGYIGAERSNELTSLHRQLFYWILAGVGLHVIGVALHWFIGKERLVHAMFTGRKSLPPGTGAVGIQSSRTWLAVLTVLAVIAVLTYFVVRAPEPSFDEFYM